MFEPGDIVECINDCACPSCGRPAPLKLRKLYHVEAVSVVMNVHEMLHLTGVPNWPRHFPGYHSARFRKVEKSDDDFAEEMRRMRPMTRYLVPVREKEDA